MEVRVGLAGQLGAGGDNGWVSELEKRKRLGQKDDDDEVWDFCSSWITAG